MKTLRILRISAMAGALLAFANIASAQTASNISAPKLPSNIPPSTPAGPTPPQPAAGASPTAEHPKGIRFVIGPPNGDQIVTDNAWDRLRTSVNPQEMRVLPIYRVSGADVIIGQPLMETMQDQFIYYIHSSGKLLGWMLLIKDPKSGLWRVVASSHDSDGIPPAAFDTLASMDRVKAGSYEVREIIYTMRGNQRRLLWLTSDPGGVDLFYLPIPDPLPPKGLEQPGLFVVEPGTLYTTEEFVKALQVRWQAFQALRPPRGGRQGAPPVPLDVLNPKDERSLP